MLRRSVLCFAVVLVSFACGSSPTGPSDPSNPSGPPAPTSTTGTLTVRLTDSPFGAARAVLITFSEVAVLRGNDWERVPFPDGSTSTWTCDLKKLENNAQDVIAAGTLPLAEYTWVRFTIQSAKLYGDNAAQSPTPCARSIPEPAGASYVMSMASREARTNGSFPVVAGKATSMLIDFDGESSVREPNQNNFVLDPVIRLMSVQQ
jgi:hypothetical protein